MEENFEDTDWMQFNMVCPRCGSRDIVVDRDQYGYFHVIQCHKCGYRYVDASNVKGVLG